jgi:hypothetical protein
LLLNGEGIEFCGRRGHGDADTRKLQRG